MLGTISQSRQKEPASVNCIHQGYMYGYLPRSFCRCALGELREDADEQLFYSSMYNSNRVLHRLLPQPNKKRKPGCR